MTSQPKAFINPAILRWARSRMRMSTEVAAEKAEIPQDLLPGWEAGQARPSIPQLRRLAKVYRQPIAAFYLPTPPKGDLPSLRDFRRLPQGQTEPLSLEIAYELDDAVNRRSILLDLGDAIGRGPRPFRRHANVADDPEHVGDRMRRLLEVSPDQQSSWRDGRVAFNHWRARVEALDVLVFQATGLTVASMRGCSIQYDLLPIIIVNRKDAYVGRTFTLFHELTHLFLRAGAICDLDTEARRPPRDQRVEIFCNKVAAVTLMPREDVESQVERLGVDTIHDSGALRQLARNFAVSEMAMLLRLHDLSLTKRAFVSDMARRLQKRGKRKTAKRGYVDPVTDTLSASGRPYSRTVLDAFDGGHITSSDVSRYLRLRVKHLTRIEESLRGARP